MARSACLRNPSGDGCQTLRRGGYLAAVAGYSHFELVSCEDPLALATWSRSLRGVRRAVGRLLAGKDEEPL